ncbi:hypothetical protein SRABI106_04807 [Rahnella aquatilis]|nr:hypothetical protein SRABI106_04807 [Rahnella aquatilis]
MNHFDVVTGTICTDVSHTSVAIFSTCCDFFKNRCYQRVGFFLTARHDRRAFQCALFTAGNAGTDEVETLLGQFAVTANGVFVIGVTAIDQDVAFIQVRSQGCDGFISCFTGFHHQQDTTRFFQRVNKLFDGVVRNQIFTRIFSDDFISLVA